MRKFFATGFATAAAATLVMALAQPAFAAPKNRNQVSKDATRAYGAAAPRTYYAPNGYAPNGGSVVTWGNRVIGQDPDPNIRAQILRDPFPGNIDRCRMNQAKPGGIPALLFRATVKMRDSARIQNPWCFAPYAYLTIRGD
jgi:hypothetical protein